MNEIRRYAKAKDGSHTLWVIGKEVYRVTDETLDTFGMPQAKRYENHLAAMEHFWATVLAKHYDKV